MEKERILSELKARIGDPNVASKFSNITERTLEEYVGKILPSIEKLESIDDSFYTTHIGILETVAGNIRYAASSAVEDYKKNSKHSDSQLKPLSATPSQVPSSQDKPEWFTKLEQDLEQLKTDKANEIKAAKQKQILSNVTAKAKELGADQSDLLEMVIGSTPLAENVTEDDYLKLIKTKYDEKYSKIYGEGVRPAYGTSAHAFNSKKARENYRRHLEATGRIKNTQTNTN